MTPEPEPPAEQPLAEIEAEHYAHNLRLMEQENVRFLERTRQYFVPSFEPTYEEVARYDCAFDLSSDDDEEFNVRKLYPEIFELYGYEY